VFEYSNIFRGRKTGRVSLNVGVAAEQGDWKERSRVGGKEGGRMKKERQKGRIK
jgi:hypothetical protein